MMTCEDFEMLMANALGNELSDADRPAFEAHLAECETCRREYETTRRAVTTMCELAGPEQVDIRHEGNRLVIEDRRAVVFDPRGGPRRLKPAAHRFGNVFRYAASILIAFAAGYGLHAGLMVSEAFRPQEQIAQKEKLDEDAAASTSLQLALVDTHVRHPSRSDLAKCLIAMAGSRN